MFLLPGSDAYFIQRASEGMCMYDGFYDSCSEYDIHARNPNPMNYFNVLLTQCLFKRDPEFLIKLDLINTVFVYPCGQNHLCVCIVKLYYPSSP